MSPAEWTALSALLTTLLVAVTNAFLTRAQTRKVKAETDAILREVRPNGGGSSHDKVMRKLTAVEQLAQAHGSLLAVHIAESTADRQAIHRVIDGRPWESAVSPSSPQPWAE